MSEPTIAEQTTDPNERIRCPICGKDFKVLLLHMVKIHKTDTKEFHRQHPGEKFVIESLSKIYSRTMTASNAYLKSPRFEGKRHTLESRMKISEGSKAMWKRLSPETIARIGRNHLGWRHTEESLNRTLSSHKIAEEVS